MQHKSGSRWGGEEWRLFNVSEVDLLDGAEENDRDKPVYLKEKLKESFGFFGSNLVHDKQHRFLSGLSINEHQTVPHCKVYESAPDQLAPFLTLLSVAKEVEKPQGTSRQQPSRMRQEPSRLGVKPDESPAQSSTVSFKTTESAHKRRAKKETVTNTLVVLFLQATLEMSGLRGRSRNERPNPYLEWHIEPHAFSIEASEHANNYACRTINDGSLFSKGIEENTKRWGKVSNLVYCSIEVGSLPVPHTPFFFFVFEGTVSCVPCNPIFSLAKCLQS